MVHWKELGDSLWPDDFGPMFSGSAIVDWNNTSGLGKYRHPIQALIYTAAGNPTVQCLAYSSDGRTYTKYEDNPIIPQITPGNRDPKVFWYKPARHWVLLLYVELDGMHTIHFFTSKNLKEWTLASIQPGDPVDKGKYLFECPDFFELPVDGNSTNKKWVLTAANSQYAVGTFDGTHFHPQATKLTNIYGRGYYAAQTFNESPNHRRIQMGWFQTSTPGMDFNQSMTIPLELKLTSTFNGPRLTYTPIRELNSLREKTHSWKKLNLTTETPNPLASEEAELLEVRARLKPSADAKIYFMIRGVPVTYNATRQELTVFDSTVKAPLSPDGEQELTIYCDRTGLEVFANKGLVYIPMPVNIKPDNLTLDLHLESGTCQIPTLQIHHLKSAWKK